MLGEHSHAPRPTLSRSEQRKQLCPGGSLRSVVVERVTGSHKELATGLHQCPHRPAKVGTSGPWPELGGGVLQGSIQSSSEGQPVTHKQDTPIPAAAPHGSCAEGVFELDNDTF